MNLNVTAANKAAALPSARTMSESIRLQVMTRGEKVGFPNEDALELHLAEALIYSKAMWWNTCLERMIDAMAWVERSKAEVASIEVLETHATITHNLGSVLHQLGHFEAAKAFYDEAHSELAGLTKAEPEGLAWLQQAIMQPFDPRPKQLEFMKARSDMAATRQKPDPTLYLSPWGQEVRLSQQEVAEAVARAKDLEGEDKKPEWIESLPRHYPVGSTPRAQLW